MTKNNTGEAILISAMIFCYLYFKPTSFLVLAGMLILIIISVFTWVMISGEIRDEGNELKFEQLRLQNKKLRIEIEKLEKELK